jgi:hypothetical protein
MNVESQLSPTRRSGSGGGGGARHGGGSSQRSARLMATSCPSGSDARYTTLKLPEPTRWDVEKPVVAVRSVASKNWSTIMLGPLESSELSRRSTHCGTAIGGGSTWMPPESWERIQREREGKRIDLNVDLDCVVGDDDMQR